MPDPRTDLLVVSTACLSAINREPFRQLARLGWSVRLVVPEHHEAPGFSRDADPSQAGDPPIDFVRLGGTTPRLWRYAGLRALLDRHDPRAVFADLDPGSLVAIEIGRWARRHPGPRRPLSTISYDNIERTLAGETRRGPGAAARYALVRLLSRLAAPSVDRVYVLSDDGRRVMDSLGYGGRSRFIPLGFDPKLFRPDPAARERIRAELGLDRPTVAYFGRLVPEKGVHLLLDALATLADRPWQLLMDQFGEYRHPYADELRAQIGRLGLGDRVVSFDAPHERVAEYMNAVDVVAVPSISTPRWKEQYGRVAPEAMACGRAVVVSSSGALPGLVADGAEVVPENDVHALARALGELLADPARRALLGARALERAHGALSITSQVAAMDEDLRGWLGRPAAR